MRVSMYAHVCVCESEAHNLPNSVPSPVEYGTHGIFFCLFILFCFFEVVSLCSLGCPGTHSVDQAGLKLKAVCLPLLGLKACATSA